MAAFVGMQQDGAPANYHAPGWVIPVFVLSLILLAVGVLVCWSAYQQQPKDGGAPS